MATVVVFGASGYAGGHIARESASRGHRVVALARTAPDLSAENIENRAGSIHDTALVEELAKDADVIVSAVKAAESDQGRTLVDAVPNLLAAAQQNGARLGVVGGAGSLKVSEDGPRVVDTEKFPDEFKPEALAHAEVLDRLRDDDTGADWFYLSPAASFGAWNAGERTGEFRLGGDVLLTDANGESAISGADFAVAFVDEIENPQHSRRRFSVAY